MWLSWSADALERAADRGPLVINPIIYAEVSTRFSRIEDLDRAVPAEDFDRSPLPWAAAFLAAKAFQSYRHRGGTRTSTLPDCFIGAHAAVDGHRLLTRDAASYRSYFPRLDVDAPN